MRHPRMPCPRCGRDTAYSIEWAVRGSRPVLRFHKDRGERCEWWEGPRTEGGETVPTPETDEVLDSDELDELADEIN